MGCLKSKVKAPEYSNGYFNETSQDQFLIADVVAEVVPKNEKTDVINHAVSNNSLTIKEMRYLKLEKFIMDTIVKPFMKKLDKTAENGLPYEEIYVSNSIVIKLLKEALYKEGYNDKDIYIFEWGNAGFKFRINFY